jgi:hypothetical protein
MPRFRGVRHPSDSLVYGRALSEALDAAFEELRHSGHPEVVREIIATLLQR